MPREIVQDVIVKKRTIRDIPLKRGKSSAPPRKEQNSFSNDGYTPPREPTRKKRWVLWIIAFISICAVAFALSSSFARATIYVVPKKASVTLKDTFTATKSAKEGLPFEVMTLTLDAQKDIPATIKKEVSQKASGTIVIYNNYSSASQKLIANTRFESPDGKIYRIPTSIVIPGRTTKNGVTTPGSIEATVSAMSAGEEYNMKLSDLKGDFTIPGFKGDPRYKEMYARLKSDLTGGKIGVIETADPVVIESVVAELKSTLENNIVSKAYAEKPDSYLLSKGSYWIDIETNNVSGESSGTVGVKVVATLHAIIFPTKDLALYLKNLKAKDGELELPLSLEEGSNFMISVNTTKSAKPWTENVIGGSVEGDAVIVSAFDEEKLYAISQGASGEQFQLSAQALPGVESVRVVLRPGWKNTLPSERSNIKILIES